MLCLMAMFLLAVSYLRFFLSLVFSSLRSWSSSMVVCRSFPLRLWEWLILYIQTVRILIVI